ncbi:MAG: endonuclease MutS2 [Ruminococcaceae bacterium]|nr:endonuclease MutS2 [Oscillospiraceae bacterium]
MKTDIKTQKKLEYDEILKRLAACAPTAGAAERALALLPDDDADTVKRNLIRTGDACRLLSDKGMPSFGSVADVTDAVERAGKGATLSTRDLLDVGNILRTARGLLDYIRVNRRFDTVLDELFERLLPDRRLEDRIYRAIVAEDVIADEASPALGEIRRKIRQTNNKIKETLQHYITSSTYSKALQENIVTMRNGRYVVPVRVESKNEIKGLIHDTSSSGATIFVEPMAVVDANNELRMLEAKEQHEIDRVLAELSALVSGEGSALLLNYQNISELAFIFACGKLAEQMNATAPVICEERRVNLINARHPLIDKDRVVPICVSLGGEWDTLIITGPNTGGKTVTLKTLGLFALMAQSGLFIPADEGSALCLFDRVLVDLGDEQSIEQSLSTFSSHMVHIVDIVQDLSPKALVLFDELGAGTDPVEGAALAVAIVSEVRRAGALAALTTHYAELKAYALETQGVQNASCEFDVATLRPTYRLVIGTPGKSNAFAISEKLGLSERIVNEAKSLISNENRRFEHVIEKLEEARVQMERDRAEAARLRAEYESQRADAKKMTDRAQATADKLLSEAQSKASALVESARASSEFVFQQLEQVRRERESERLGEHLDATRRAVRAHLRENESRFNPVEERSNEEYKLPRPLRKGDEVYLVDIDKKGVLLSDPDHGGNVMVQAGIIRTKSKVSNLRLIEEDATVKSGEQKSSVKSFRASVSRDFKDEIDLRGKTGDEAWFMVDKYFDTAILAGFHTVRLIHGKGTGALKVALWKYLKSDKRIRSFRIGQYGEGDGGVTVVELK